MHTCPGDRLSHVHTHMPHVFLQEHTAGTCCTCRHIPTHHTCVMPAAGGHFTLHLISAWHLCQLLPMLLHSVDTRPLCPPQHRGLLHSEGAVRCAGVGTSGWEAQCPLEEALRSTPRTGCHRLLPQSPWDHIPNYLLSNLCLLSLFLGKCTWSQVHTHPWPS